MRKGITPVVAMVLLLMMTVAAGGAAYVWTQGLIGGQRQQTQQELNTELTKRDASCSGNSLTVTVSNTGGVEIISSSTDVFVSTLDGTLQGQVSGTSLAGGSINPGETADLSVSNWDTNPGMSAGTTYEVAFEFQDFDWSTTCQAS